MSDFEELQQEIRTSALENKAATAELRAAIAEMRLDVIQRFGTLMDAVADLRTEYRNHTHLTGEDE